MKLVKTMLSDSIGTDSSPKDFTVHPKPVNQLGRRAPLQMGNTILLNTLLKLWHKHAMSTIFDNII